MDLQEFHPQYHTALRLLIPLWRGLDADYKSRYSRTIWTQFEDNIRSAAYTSNLSNFYSRFCARLTVAVETALTPELHSALAVGGAEERRVLRQLRDEAATLALMVRLDNERRREQYQARKEHA